MTAGARSVDATVTATTGDGPRLVVPEGWVIDGVVRERLARVLDRAPSHVAGVVAETGELPPGASYRVHAEWRSLESPSRLVESNATSARGAVLVRPGVGFEARGDVVDVGGGSLLVDPGAHVHDPWRPIGPLEVASELGRPPFPRRPVVAFVAGERDGELADWARRLVNRLVRRDVEARLALPDVADGLHLTRPCLSCAESIRLLAPDVVIALDESAMSQVPRWCGADRSTVVIELVSDPSGTVQLVSWQLGRAAGRVRARINRRVAATSLVELVHRLCAGPHPMPPSDIAAPDRSDRVTSAGRSLSPARRTAAVVTGVLDAAGSSRVEGFVDHLTAVGVPVAVTPLEHEIPPGVLSADLALLVGAQDSDMVHQLIDARRRAGRRTVLDLGAPDALRASGTMEAGPVLTTRAARLANACGLVTSPGGAVHEAVRRLGVRAHVLASPLTRKRADGLDQACAALAFAPTSELVVGWHAGSAEAPTPTYLDRVAEGIAKLLAADVEVRVEFVGDVERVPTALRGHDRVVVASGEVQSEVIAGWAVHLWTPPMIEGEVLDDLRGFVEASYAGVPTVMPAPIRTAVDGWVRPEILVAGVDDPEDWMAAVRTLIDDEERRARLSAEAARMSRAVWGPVAWRAAMNRFVGWALYDPT
ncbi:MAG: hypothetical protein ACRDY6_07010 [Acidimicrobiia bacterium]